MSVCAVIGGGGMNEGEARSKSVVVIIVAFSMKVGIRYKPVAQNQIGVQF